LLKDVWPEPKTYGMPLTPLHLLTLGYQSHSELCNKARDLIKYFFNSAESFAYICV
jgi:hypothetical protein